MTIYLAKNAAMLMLRLVSGVTISVFEKSILPSPGCGIGNPTPIPAATCAGTTDVVVWDEPAGGMMAKLAPDGIITLSFVVPVVEAEEEDELLPELPTKFEVPSTDIGGVAELPEPPTNGVIRREETACFDKLASA